MKSGSFSGHRGSRSSHIMGAEAFKIIIIFAALLIMNVHHVLAAFEIPTADSSFANSCAYPGANLTDHWLGVYCLNNDQADYSYNYTWMDLDQCVANNDGQLVGYIRGNYSHSCTGCDLQVSGSLYLQCSCPATGGNMQTSSVDLNGFLSNVDGALSCFNQLGNKTARA